MALANPGTGVSIALGPSEDTAVNSALPVSVYSVTEDSTPVAPDDSTGGYGQMTLTTLSRPNDRSLRDQYIALTDGAQGETAGYIRALRGDGFQLELQADSFLARTAVTRQAAPYIGTLGGALRYYLGLCGIHDHILIDLTLNDRPVALLGWNGVVYDQLKKLLAAHAFEVSYISRTVVFRPLRGRIAVDYRDSSVQWTVDATNRAQRVEAYSYSVTTGTNLAYPAGGWNEDVTIYSVDAGQTQVIDIPLDGSLSAVEQPTCVTFVDRNESGSSVYSVSGNDGIAIPPAQWAAGGGSLTVEIGEDTRSLKVTIKGSSDTQYAPYQIAVSAGESDYYSSLRIRGTGVFYTKELHSLPACLDKDQAPEEVGATIENEFIDSPDRAHHALLWSAARFSMPRATINVTTRGINRKDDNGSYRYPTIGLVKDTYPGATIGDLKVALGPTIGDWNEKLFSLVRSSFANQAFGNIAGARVRYEDCWYRIRTATTAPGSVQYAAEWDNTIGDVYHTGESIGEWNARWTDKAIRDVNETPLQGL